jgi:hypothetical protein
MSSHSKNDLKISTKRIKTFGKTYKMVEIFCFVIFITGLSRLNTGNDDDDLENINMKQKVNRPYWHFPGGTEENKPVRIASTQQETSKCKSANLSGSNYTSLHDQLITQLINK